MSVEILANRYQAVPFTHTDAAGNVYVQTDFHANWCGRIVPEGMIFHHRRIGRVFVPVSHADTRRMEMLNLHGDPGTARQIEHIHEMIEQLLQRQAIRFADPRQQIDAMTRLEAEMLDSAERAETSMIVTHERIPERAR